MVFLTCGWFASDDFLDLWLVCMEWVGPVLGLRQQLQSDPGLA
jgi:hypothetical protein